MLAYHDRSDGGAFAALCEMAFASRMGLELHLDAWGENAVSSLFNEELGAIVQIAAEDRAAFADLVNRHDLTHCAQRIGKPIAAPVGACRRSLLDEREVVAEWLWQELFDAWWSVTHAMQRLRDNPDCADEERDARRDFADPGLVPQLAYDLEDGVAAPLHHHAAPRPRVAILREQGVNSHLEMAAAFDKAGFTAVDVHMSDLIAGRVRLDRFKARGLRRFQLRRRAGRRPRLGHVDPRATGAARSVRRILRAPEQLQPGRMQRLPDAGPAEGPDPRRRALAALPAQSQRAIRSATEPGGSASSRLRCSSAAWPVRAFRSWSRMAKAARSSMRPSIGRMAQVALRFVDGHGQVADAYPTNPNGSPDGITGLTSADGRSTLLMPHPERVHRSVQMSWRPAEWGEDSPWMQLFHNARDWV